MKDKIYTIREKNEKARLKELLQIRLSSIVRAPESITELAEQEEAEVALSTSKKTNWLDNPDELKDRIKKLVRAQVRKHLPEMDVEPRSS